MCFQVVFEFSNVEFCSPVNGEIESANYFNFCFICQSVSASSCQPSVSLDFFDTEVCQAVCSIALIFLVNVIFDHECCRGQATGHQSLSKVNAGMQTLMF